MLARAEERLHADDEINQSTREEEVRPYQLQKSGCPCILPVQRGLHLHDTRLNKIAIGWPQIRNGPSYDAPSIRAMRFTTADRVPQKGWLWVQACPPQLEEKGYH